MVVSDNHVRRIRMYHSEQPSVVQIAPQLDVTSWPAAGLVPGRYLEARTPLTDELVPPDLVEWEFNEDSSACTSDSGTDTDCSDPLIISAYTIEIQQRVQQHQAVVGMPPDGERCVINSQDVLRCVVRRTGVLALAQYECMTHPEFTPSSPRNTHPPRATSW